MGGRDIGIVGRNSEDPRASSVRWAARCAGQPGVVLLVGPAGIGKTALWRRRRSPTPRPCRRRATLNEEDGHFMHGMVAEFEVA